MRQRLWRVVATLILLASLSVGVIGSAAPAEAHARYPGSWTYFYWVKYGAVSCWQDSRMMQWQERIQTWRVYDVYYGYWINDHDHFITGWFTQVGWCNQQA